MKKNISAYFKVVFFLNIFLLVSMFSFAQENVFIAAEKLFEKGEYYSAAKLYEKYLLPADKKVSENSFRPYSINRKEPAPKTTNEPGTSMAVWKLAESYRLSNDFTDAEKWYRTCIEKYPSLFPLVLYRYAICLRANKNYPAAETSLNDFLASYHNKDQYEDDAKRELANLTFIRLQLEKNRGNMYDIARIANPTEGGCFAVSFAPDTVMVFTSTLTDRDALGKNINPYKNRLFNTVISNSQFGNIIPLEINNTDVNMNQGAATFSPDGRKMFFTQWEKKEDKLNAAIYFSTTKAGKWSKPVKASMVNMDGYSSMQPFITTDGKYLFFSSDRPGGVGNFDLWYATLDDAGNISTPVNLGKQVNTVYDEKTAFYAIKEHQLVFSTNGRTGLGGFDFFVANGDGIDAWGAPVNMGIPFNSSKDDLYFFARESKNGSYEAYISSDRESVCCLELYRIEKTKNYRRLTGTLVDCISSLPLEKGKIYVTSQPGGTIVDSLITDTSGKFIFNVNKEDSLDFRGTKDGYNNNSLSLKIPPGTTNSFEPDSLSSFVICLQNLPPETNPPAEKETAVENENSKSPGEKEIIIHFDFDKYNLEGSEKSKLDSVLTKLLKDPEMIVEIGGYTDEKGTDEYNLDLGYNRAKATAKYLISSGIPVKRIRLKSYGECCPASVDQINNQDEKNRLNRRVQFIFSKKAAQ